MKIATLRKKILVQGLILSLLGDLGSGMFFGVGYMMIDHLDEWRDAKTPSEVADRNPHSTSKRGSLAQRSSPD